MYFFLSIYHGLALAQSTYSTRTQSRAEASGLYLEPVQISVHTKKIDFGWKERERPTQVWGVL